MMKAIDFLGEEEKPAVAVDKAVAFLDEQPKKEMAQNPDWFNRSFPNFPNEQLDEQRQGAERNQETLFKSIQNTPESVYGLAKNIWQAISHPVDTVKALYDTAKGGVQKLTPGEQPEEKNFDAMIQFFSERYGGAENLRSTIEKDPAGFLADVSTVLTGAGGVVRGGAAVASKAGTTAAKVAAPVGELGAAAMKVGAAVDPLSVAVSGGVNVAGKVVPKSGRLSPETLYESALKPSTTLSKDERMARVSTALENKILPTQEGLDKIRTLISEIDDKVSETVKSGPYPPQPINTDVILKYLDELESFAENTVNPQKALAEIKTVKTRFQAAHGKAISAEAAHNIKKNTYVELKRFYDQFQRSATIEAKKQIARGLKEEVYAIYPELREMGKKEGSLIALEESIEKAANRISNRDIMGIGVPIKGGFGAVVGDKVGAIAMTAAALLDTPQIKARLAQALYHARKGVGPLKGGAVRSAAFQAGRIDEETNETNRP